MEKKLFLGLCLVGWAALMVGCSPRVAVTPTALVSPTALVTQLPLPTKTVPASQTPVASSTSLAATETPAGVSVATVAPDLTTYERQVSQLFSPDGRYIGRVLSAYPPVAPDGLRAGNQYYTRVWLYDTTNNQIIEIEETWQNIGLGNTTPSILRWSEDSTKLFLADSGSPDGCGSIFYQNLRVYDLAAGELTNLSISHDGLVSVSPDGGQILIFAPGEIQVIDSGTFTEGIIPFESPTDQYWAVSPVWSPDGNSLLFGALTNPCVSFDAQQTWLYLVSIMTGEVSVLKRDDPDNLVAVSWPFSGLAALRSRDGQDWWLDVPAQTINQTPPAEIANARSALFGFFNSLNNRNYSDAPRYFGGAYDVLRDINPSVDPEDKAQLLENACTINGYVCMPIFQATLEGQPEPGQLVFRVMFSVDEGHLFEFGPCCGADITDMPPVYEFKYLVQRDVGGTWLVMDLPVFVP